MRKNNKLLFIGIFILSTAILLTPLFFKDILGQFQSLGLLGIFFINFFSSATLFLPTPGLLSIAVASKIYPPLAVAVLGSLGSALGEGIGFLFGHSSMQVLNGRKYKLLYHLNKFIFKQYGMYILVLFALIPNPIVDGLGILAGIAKYPIHRFLLAVFIGRFLRNLVIVYIGLF